MLMIKLHPQNVRLNYQAENVSHQIKAMAHDPMYKDKIKFFFVCHEVIAK